MTPPVFRRASLRDILAYVEARRAAGDQVIALRALDPDRGRGHYAGELVELEGVPHVHRSWQVWVDLADRLGLRLLTPRATDHGLVELRFEPLDLARRWQAPGATAAERYGPTSGYARIAKLEDPSFVLDLRDALARARLGAAPRVLDLGVNTGDELALILEAAPGATGVGVDHSAAALATARARYPAFRFVEADLGQLASLGLGRFDLVISLNTLQSPGVDDRALLRELVQRQLAPGGAVILGLPNARYVDGEVSHGARMKNFRQPELGLLIKDVAFYRKYLQQHDRQVFVTGKHTLLVTAVAAAEPTDGPAGPPPPLP